MRQCSNIVDPVINLFSPNELRSHFHICDHSIVTFGIRGFCLGVLNTSDVDSLDRFRKPVVDKLKTDVCIKKKENYPKENNIKIEYEDELFKNQVMGGPKRYVYQFIGDENDHDETNIIQYFIMHGLVLFIKVDSYVAHIFYAWSFSHNTEVPI